MTEDAVECEGCGVVLARGRLVVFVGHARVYCNQVEFIDHVDVFCTRDCLAAAVLTHLDTEAKNPASPARP